MKSDQSLRELLARGVQPTFVEAVAIAQELMTDVPADARPPFGPPSLDNVRISCDGSVECLACAVTPGVSEIASLLDALLPRGATTRVPGGLRYTIARALLEVDAPPFDSVAALSAALARHEQGDRADVIRGLYARAVATLAGAPATRCDRRRRAPSSAEFRRQLRQADEALFLQARAVTAAVIESPRAADVVPADAGSTAGPWLVAGAMATLIAFGAGYTVVDRIQATRRHPDAVSSAPVHVHESTRRARQAP